jgi:hypothetical protein
MTYLLDTNVISELRKRHPDPDVVAWFGTVSSAEIFISVLTIGEIRPHRPRSAVGRLVTRNAADLASSAVMLLNPFAHPGRT